MQKEKRHHSLGGGEKNEGTEGWKTLAGGMGAKKTSPIGNASLNLKSLLAVDRGGKKDEKGRVSSKKSGAHKVHQTRLNTRGSTTLRREGKEER